jgi:HK97 family phage prohead protease
MTTTTTNPITETKKTNQKFNRTVEIRDAQFSEENDAKILEGYAVVFDSPTVLYEYDGVEYKEIIAKDAFDNADLKDVVLKYNHGDAKGILARTRNGSLQITIDEHGLKFRASLLNTPSSNEVYECVKNGLLDKCSFAFRCEEDAYNQDTHTRTILKIKRVYDLSVVDIPAYDDTNVEARNYFDGRAKDFHAMERAKKIQRLICKTYL